MKNWIARLFKGAGDATPEQPPASASATSSPAAPAPPAIQADDAALEQRFWHWLCNLPTDTDPAAPAARLVLDELARLARAPGQAADMVPRVPEVIPRLLRSLRADEVSGTELAREVTRDAVLVAEVIREANSPFYRPARPVRTVDAAILVLGHNGLRMLLARVAFRPIFKASNGRLSRLAAPRLWLHSERCARAAGMLAPTLRADPFEAYLAGLMLDLGLIVAIRLIDQLDDDGPPPHGPAVLPALLSGARQLSARVALYAELPPPITAAILAASEPDAQPLARALGQADRLAWLSLLLGHGAMTEADPLVAGLDRPAARILERLGPEPG